MLNSAGWQPSPRHPVESLTNREKADIPAGYGTLYRESGGDESRERVSANAPTSLVFNTIEYICFAENR